MISIRMRFAIALCLIAHLLGISACTEKPRELSAAAQKTIQILSELEFDAGTVTAQNLDETFEKIKACLAQKGITVRLRKSSSREVPSGWMKFQKTTLREFMDVFDEWAGWGWIVYDDGSITYVDRLCGCSWPKGGVQYHEDQYQMGTPEALRLQQIEQKTKSPDN
jgi:hypothetical protein